MQLLWYRVPKDGDPGFFQGRGDFFYYSVLRGDWWESTSASSYAHADQHAIVFHPQYDGNTNRTMFVGNDGGLFKTTNARAAVGTSATADLSCAPPMNRGSDRAGSPSREASV